jgi:hypothetical protein
MACVALILMMSMAVFAQEKAMYQAGTVTDVQLHQPSKGAKSYDVTVKVGNVLYVVMFTPPGGSDAILYKAGMETTVFVDGKNMKVNDITGKTWTVPILRQKEATAAGK